MGYMKSGEEVIVDNVTYVAVSIEEGNLGCSNCVANFKTALCFDLPGCISDNLIFKEKENENNKE